MGVYFLSARFNLHRNYAEHYLKKGDLTNKDINHILSRIDISKKTAFDAEYADSLYIEYQNHRIDDTKALNAIQLEFSQKNLLILAPGFSIKEKEDTIKSYINDNDPLVVAVNFLPEGYKTDYVFFNNNK